MGDIIYRDKLIEDLKDCSRKHPLTGMSLTDVLETVNSQTPVHVGLTVGDVVSACEFVGCDVFDACGNMIPVTKENAQDIYSRAVESLDAAGGMVRIWTFDNIDKVEGINPKNEETWVKVTDDTLILLMQAAMDKIAAELARLYWNKNQKEIASPFLNTGTEYHNDYFTVRSYNWDDNDQPNFESRFIRVHWYKHSNRGVELEMMYGFDSAYTIATTLRDAVKSLNEDPQFATEDMV